MKLFSRLGSVSLLGSVYHHQLCLAWLAVEEVASYCPPWLTAPGGGTQPPSPLLVRLQQDRLGLAAGSATLVVGAVSGL